MWQDECTVLVVNGFMGSREIIWHALMVFWSTMLWLSDGPLTSWLILMVEINSIFFFNRSTTNVIDSIAVAIEHYNRYGSNTDWSIIYSLVNDVTASSNWTY